MTGGRTAPRIFILAAVMTIVVGVIGVIVTLGVYAFVFDEYDAFG